jgi:tripartite-type tricarboxylate transporter receptor subunit TctC
MTHKRLFLKSCGLGLLSPSLLTSRPIQAQTSTQPLYRSRTVEFAYTVPPGSALDGFFRRTVDLISGFLPHGAYFTNRPGGNSLVGTRHTLRFDGSPKVLVSSTTPIVLNPLFNADLGYHPFRDFFHEFLLLRQPMFLVCNPAVAKNFKEFISLGQKQNRVLKASSTGINGILDLQSRIIEKHFNLNVIHAPYTSNFILPVLSNEVDFSWITANNTALPFIETGRLIPIATTGARRNPLYPDIPALNEYIPGYQSNVIFGLSIPQASADHRVSLKNAGVDWNFIHKTLVKEYKDQGFDFDTLKNSLQYEKVLQEEVKQWKSIISKYSLNLK